jgi:alpha-L-fucosidase
MLDETFSEDLALSAKVSSSGSRGDVEMYSAEQTIDGNRQTYWTLDDGEATGYIELEFQQPELINYVLLQEYIELGQRVRDFEIQIHNEDGWTSVAEGTTIGYKRIVKLNPTTTNKLRIVIKDSKACPVISTVSVY